MRTSTRVTYNKEVGLKSIEGYKNLELGIEEFPGELKLSWWLREIPSLVLLSVVAYYIFNAFGLYYFLFISAMISPILAGTVLIWLLDHKFH